MYFGGPMTYDQAKTFCAKDNATMPYIDKHYSYHAFTEYLQREQDDWRYYDMVWVQDYDNKEGQCTVLVDNTVETVNCDYLLPTLCEYDRYVDPSITFPGEVIYAGVAVAAGLVLVCLVCCLWITKTRQRKKERFERRNSIRLSKTSLGSRSLVSMNSTGFSDINYR